MMRIAVASENGKVTEHFGHCQGFMLFDTDNNQIVKSETIPNPGHKPGFLPNFLADRGVNVIISGGMGGGGGGARDTLNRMPELSMRPSWRQLR